MRARLKNFLFLGACVFSILLTGCASTPKDEDNQEKVSTLPWNRPQNWEHSMPMGGGGAY